MKNSWRWVRVTELISTNWLSFLEDLDRLYVGFSGGIDSTVLLHALSSCPSLAKKTIAIHINHNLSKNARNWQTHCQTICKLLNIPFITEDVIFDNSANIEKNARQARYDFFQSLIQSNEGLLLGHHQNDQAETLLLQLCRGAGVQGLAAMTSIRNFSHGQLIRPFLEHSREILEIYANENNLHWVEDESNNDSGYTRNFLRHEVFPLLQTRWPNVLKNFSQTSAHCQEANTHLEDLAKIDCPDLINVTDRLSLEFIDKLSQARIKNVLRVWFKTQQILVPDTTMINRIVNELIFSSQDARPEIQWGEVILRRYQHCLYLGAQEAKFKSLDWPDFPSSLKLMGNSWTLYAEKTQEGICVPAQCRIQVRFREGGETICLRGQHKSLKKLFQEWKIPPWQRDQIPLIYFDESLAVVVGYAISDTFFQKSGDVFQVYRKDS